MFRSLAEFSALHLTLTNANLGALGGGGPCTERGSERRTSPITTTHSDIRVIADAEPKIKRADELSTGQNVAARLQALEQMNHAALWLDWRQHVHHASKMIAADRR